jgi:hypothetical protein
LSRFVIAFSPSPAAHSSKIRRTIAASSWWISRRTYCRFGRPSAPGARTSTLRYQIPPVVARVINTILRGLNIDAQIPDAGGISSPPKLLVNTGWYHGRICR